MLGRLARWIRFLGFHVVYPNPAMDDKDIIDICVSNDLILVTRDRELSRRYEKSILIESTDTNVQLREFVRSHGYNPLHIMTVCPLCDGNLVQISRDDVEGKVPDGVLQNASSFWICDSCKKLYWDGSHYKRISKTIEDMTGRKI